MTGQAKTRLSELIGLLEKEEEIVIAKSGKPVAKIVPFTEANQKRIGFAEGKLPLLSSLEDFNSIVSEEEFSGGGIL